MKKISSTMYAAFWSTGVRRTISTMIIIVFCLIAVLIAIGLGGDTGCTGACP